MGTAVRPLQFRSVRGKYKGKQARSKWKHSQVSFHSLRRGDKEPEVAQKKAEVADRREASSRKASLILFNEQKKRNVICCFMQARAEVFLLFLSSPSRPPPGHLAAFQRAARIKIEQFSPLFGGPGPRTFKYSVSHPSKHLHSTETSVM